MAGLSLQVVRKKPSGEEEEEEEDKDKPLPLPCAATLLPSPVLNSISSNSAIEGVMDKEAAEGRGMGAPEPYRAYLQIIFS